MRNFHLPTLLSIVGFVALLGCTPPMAKKPDLSVQVQLVESAGRAVVVAETVDSATGNIDYVVNEAVDARTLKPKVTAADGVTVTVIRADAQPLAWTVKAEDQAGNEKSILIKASIADGLVSLTWTMDGRLPRLESAPLGALFMEAETFLADLLGEDVDFCFSNAGALKGNIVTGTTTREGLKSVFPYDNKHVIVEMSGQNIIDALNHGVSWGGLGPFPVVSKELTFTSAISEAGAFSATAIKLNGVSIDPGKTYRVMTNDFLVQPDASKANDGYDMMRNLVTLKTSSVTPRESFYLYLAALGPNPAQPAFAPNLTFDLSAFISGYFHVSSADKLNKISNQARQVAREKSKVDPAYMLELRLAPVSFDLSQAQLNHALSLHPAVILSGGWSAPTMRDASPFSTVKVEAAATSWLRVNLPEPGDYRFDSIVLDLNGRTLADAVSNSTASGYSISGTLTKANEGN